MNGGRSGENVNVMQVDENEWPKWNWKEINERNWQMFKQNE